MLTIVKKTDIHPSLFVTFKSMIFALIGDGFKKASFIQVGAHRGTDYDDIYNEVKTSGWTGMLIEPLPSNFELLQEDYSGCEDLIFLQYVVSDKEGTIDFFSLKDPDKYKYGDQVNSVSEYHIVRFLNTNHNVPISQMDENIVKNSVPSRRLDSIIKEHEIEPNVIYIDTEGHDYEVIKTIDFNAVAPEIIYYEHEFLRQNHKKDCRDLLIQNNYYVIIGSHDTLAIKQDYWSKNTSFILNTFKGWWNDPRVYQGKVTQPVFPFESAIDRLMQTGELICSRFPQYKKHNVGPPP